MQPVSQRKGCQIGNRPLNRYEINFLNTIKEALEFLSSLEMITSVSWLIVFI